MKTFTLWPGVLAMIALPLVALSGCEGVSEVVGSGKLITQEYDVSQLSFSEFTMVEVEDSIQVSIMQSDTDNFSVTLTTDDNMLKHFVVDTEGYTLKLGLGETLKYRNVTTKAVITTPVLVGLFLYGGSVGTISGFNSLDNFSLRLTGGSQVTGSIVVGDCQLDLSGGSTAQLSGSGSDILITASDGSHLDLTNLEVSDAKVYLNKGSEATITVQGKLSGELSDGSHLFYYGNPTLGPVKSSGGSSIEKM